MVTGAELRFDAGSSAVADRCHDVHPERASFLLNLAFGERPSCVEASSRTSRWLVSHGLKFWASCGHRAVGGHFVRFAICVTLDSLSRTEALTPALRRIRMPTTRWPFPIRRPSAV